MLRKISLTLISALLVASLASCKSAKKNDDVTDLTGGSDMNSGDVNALGDSDSGNAMGLQTLYFPYDSFAIDGDGKKIIQANAAILKANAGVSIQIEGHCDQRGGIQYNIALGEKRANAVKGMLQSEGVDAARIATISYGKERLADAAMTDSAMAKNRRANFAITKK